MWLYHYKVKYLSTAIRGMRPFCSAKSAVQLRTMHYPDNFKSRIKNADVLAVELIDTAENIFDRLIFSDENDNLYEDNDYKELHRDYFLSDIQEDIEWYGTVYSQIGITNRFKIQNESPEQVVERMILEYNLENIILSGKTSGS